MQPCVGEELLRGREKTRKKTAGGAGVFGLRKKGTAVGLASCVGGRRCCLGREGERRPERLAFGAKITKQGNGFGEEKQRKRSVVAAVLAGL